MTLSKQAADLGSGDAVDENMVVMAVEEGC
jgi:hypothetical protein